MEVGGGWMLGSLFPYDELFSAQLTCFAVFTVQSRGLFTFRVRNEIWSWSLRRAVAKTKQSNWKQGHYRNIGSLVRRFVVCNGSSFAYGITLARGGRGFVTFI